MTSFFHPLHIAHTNILRSNRHGTPAAAAHQPTNPAEAELPVTVAGSMLLPLASRPLRLVLTATNLHLAVHTRAAQRRRLRTRLRLRVVMTVPGTTEKEIEGCSGCRCLYYVAPRRFIGYGMLGSEV